MFNNTDYFKVLAHLCLVVFLSLSAHVLQASTHEFGSFTQNQSYANSVAPEILEQEVSGRMDRVAEFKYIREVAKKHGVDIYLFGGTASAYAHYVRWDLLREDGDPKFQPERFDYFFDNIYRSNQDLDIVVDSDAKTASKIALELKKKFNHFVGDKEAWEVRLLREQTGDKLPLLNDPDFANQHTDSNSIGVIKINSNTEQAFYDLRDWGNKKSLYLKDIASASMTYLFSDKHETTSRFKEGKNPSILSAIRYLAKATQYELTLKAKDLKRIKKVIKETNIDNLSQYSKNKLSEFALKALLNSPDVEYAWDLLESTGARKLAIEADGKQADIKDSVSWWLSKEPLRSGDIGKAKGKTAKKLGIDIVAHETNSFQAFDNITRSSQGKPNVFISRQNISGEAAALGDGFYAQVGLEGARGTGITIRFKVHPDAREGVDFIYNERSEFLVFKNKNALELIPEKISLSVIEYFELLSSGEIGENDKGLANRIKTRINKMAKPSKAETKKIYKLVNSDWENNRKFSFLITEWLALEVSADYPEFLVSLIKDGRAHEVIAQHALSYEHWSRHKKGAEFMETLIRWSNADWDVLEHALSREHWAKHKKGADLLNIIVKRGRADEAVVKYILSQEHWAKHPKAVDFLEAIIKRSHYSIDVDIITHVLSKEFWASHTKSSQFLKGLMGDEDHDQDIAIHVLSKEHWAKHPKGAEFLEQLIKSKDGSNDYIAWHIFGQKHWAEHPRGAELLKKLIKNKNANSAVAEGAMSQEYWARHKEGAEILELLIKSGNVNGDIASHVLSKEYWAKHEKSIEFLEMLLEDGSVDREIAEEVLSQEYWANHPKGVEFLETIIKRGDADKEIAAYVFSQEHWVKHKKSAELLEMLIENDNADWEIAVLALYEEHWAKHPKGAGLLKLVIQNGENDDDILDAVLPKKYWKNHSEYKNLKALLKLPYEKRKNKNSCAKALK